MNTNCYNAVIKEMQVLLDGQKFALEGDVYKNDTKAVKVEYDEASKMFVLKIADVVDGTIGDFSVAASWLFEENQTERDAAAVGVDFADTLRIALGVKASRTRITNVALPTAEKGDAVNVLTLTQKLLATYPQFKESYKADVATYGKFLHLNFFVKNFVPAIQADLRDGKANKKAVKKLFDMLADMYVDGDTNTTDTVVALLCATAYGDEALTEAVRAQLGENKHMLNSFNDMLAVAKGSKKLREALGK